MDGLTCCRNLLIGMAIALLAVYLASAQEFDPLMPAMAEDFPGDAVENDANELVDQPGPQCECGRTSCCCGNCIDWSQVPGSVRPMPRPGNFPIPPSGCGYYSLLDQIHGICREKPPKSGYPRFFAMPPAFFDADFRYVESLPFDDRNLSEKLKRIPVSDCLTFSTGGSLWVRYMNEHNSRLTTNDNDYTLNRYRVFGDLMYGDHLRFFGEFIWADSYGDELAPLPVDVNLGDALNLFVEVNLFDCCGKPVYARIGRQELLFGSQRLVTTLDWANTRRTFEGVHVLRNGEKWDLDAFYTAFVPVDPDGFDQADDNQEFGGAWATYKPEKGHFADFFYLYLENTNNITQEGIVRAPTEVHTFGSRYAGDRCGYLWECWGALQIGNQDSADLCAGAATAGIGRNFSDACCSPTFWLYYDYASGDPNPGVGDAHTFNQLYPFGHYYLGWIDQVGRQNIHDLNAHLYLYPNPWTTVWLQYHHFRLDQARDALYNAGGVAIRRDPTGAAGKDVGDEIDIVVNFHVATHSDILLGYSRLFGGDFLENTSEPGLAADSELFYFLYQQRW